VFVRSLIVQYVLYAEYQTYHLQKQLSFYKLVEMDGIEPTTLCLQSIRSPN